MFKSDALAWSEIQYTKHGITFVLTVIIAVILLQVHEAGKVPQIIKNTTKILDSNGISTQEILDIINQVPEGL